MKSISFLFVLCFFVNTKAYCQTQTKPVQKDIAVGMFVKIKACTNNATYVESMDLYRKTLIPQPLVIDTATGDGIFESFFAPGDFDAKRLPCSYAGKKYKVAALRVFDDPQTKQEKRVMILYTSDALSLIWVEFDKAIELKEIEF
ncbi:MAG: hypothetical protein MUE96_02305 [Bacteroidia bacterium]|jgi:hypothetical protein|nr:hypothetical protein [Bacteroidia bacterium]